MKKSILVLLFLSLLASCSEVNVNSVTLEKETQRTETKKQKETIDYSNPGFIMGSDFGTYFQSLRKHGKYEDMIKFTSSESLEKYGKENLVDSYKNMKFAYNLGKAKIREEGDVYVLYYTEADVYATRVLVEISILIENDSCKIIIDDEFFERINLDN